jgi:hypothetical protein
MTELFNCLADEIGQRHPSPRQRLGPVTLCHRDEDGQPLGWYRREVCIWVKDGHHYSFQVDSSGGRQSMCVRVPGQSAELEVTDATWRDPDNGPDLISLAAGRAVIAGIWADAFTAPDGSLQEQAADEHS